MQILNRVEPTRQLLRRWRTNGLTLGLVPTMGYLHEGHLSLIRIARSRADKVIVSVFVNPTQFGPAEDFGSYPRDLDRDAALCEKEGVDLIFSPGQSEMYPDGYSTFVTVEGSLTQTLCGAKRPGHFRGVATVVAKLFHIVSPDFAVFGRKDAQQTVVIRRMVCDLDLPVEIVTGPIIREADGLAKSSRNIYLSGEERNQAPLIKAALDAAAAAFEAGERRAATLIAEARSVLTTAARARIDYLSLVDLETLLPVERNIQGPALLAAAVYFGKTRLIDNTLLPVDWEF
jgi:pantoate--beta-alanine ligase